MTRGQGRRSADEAAPTLLLLLTLHFGGAQVGGSGREGGDVGVAVHVLVHCVLAFVVCIKDVEVIE